MSLRKDEENEEWDTNKKEDWKIQARYKQEQTEKEIKNRMKIMRRRTKRQASKKLQPKNINKM